MFYCGFFISLIYLSMCFLIVKTQRNVSVFIMKNLTLTPIIYGIVLLMITTASIVSLKRYSLPRPRDTSTPRNPSSPLPHLPLNVFFPVDGLLKRHRMNFPVTSSLLILYPEVEATEPTSPLQRDAASELFRRTPEASPVLRVPQTTRFAQRVLDLSPLLPLWIDGAAATATVPLLTEKLLHLPEWRPRGHDKPWRGLPTRRATQRDATCTRTWVRWPITGELLPQRRRPVGSR